MNTFSIYNYENLSDSLKMDFNKSMAHRLSWLLNDIMGDDVLVALSIDDFIKSSGACLDASLIVSDLYSRISACVQVGSGNQILSLDILNAYTECWGEINKKR